MPCLEERYSTFKLTRIELSKPHPGLEDAMVIVGGHLARSSEMVMLHLRQEEMGERV